MSTNNEETQKAPRLNKRGDRRGMSEGTKANRKYIEGHSWKPGQSGNPKGRPKVPNRVPELLQQYLGTKKSERVRGLNSTEIEDIELMVLSLGNKELNSLIKGDDVPMYMKGLALAALHDAKNGRTKTIDLLRDRQFGAVKKEVDVTSNGQSVGTQTMTPEEAKDLLKRIEEDC